MNCTALQVYKYKGASYFGAIYIISDAIYTKLVRSLLKLDKLYTVIILS
jgi:hypothetical protein